VPARASPVWARPAPLISFVPDSSDVLMMQFPLYGCTPYEFYVNIRDNLFFIVAHMSYAALDEYRHLLLKEIEDYMADCPQLAAVRNEISLKMFQQLSYLHHCAASAAVSNKEQDALYTLLKNKKSLFWDSSRVRLSH